MGIFLKQILFLKAHHARRVQFNYIKYTAAEEEHSLGLGINFNKRKQFSIDNIPSVSKPCEKKSF